MDSLLPISFPSLNSTNFAKSLNEVFVNIESNFKKLSNLGLNQGAPGKSCMYLPINLAAAFLYNPFTQQDEAGDDYKLFAAWLKALDDSKTGDPDWKACLDQIEASVKADFNQFASITHLDEAAYGRIAATLIWGHPYAFNNGTPAPGSLTGTLHTKYEIREGAATFEGKTLYGNWMYELYRVKGNDNTERISKYLDMFKTHVSICPPGKITVAFTPDTQSADIYPVGSFEYWYIDPRYRCGEQIKNTGKGSSDISCVLRWTTDTYNQTKWDGHFEVLEIFPTIQVGKDGKYYWFINGLNTGIPVTGKDGENGKPAQMVIVERIENVRGWTPEQPNGYEYWSPKSGDQTIRALLESGVPSRVRMGFEQALKNRLNVDSDTPLDSSIVAGSDKSTDLQTKVISFDHTEDNAWLPDDVQFENMSNQHLYRIFRVVGRDKFWTGDEDAKIKDDVLATDEYDRLYDPSCDEYYLKKGASCINEAQSIQAYIQELDGAFAIVLPGPAFKQDRTDTTFWFATLRAVPYRYLENGDTIWQLVAFCSQNTQNTTQLDEHSQAGMMHRFDAFSYKKSSDSRNKPRGLMLPIGSAECASETASKTWAAHIIHSDAGGFLEPVDINIGGSPERRGIQNVRLNVSTTANTTAANDTSRPADGLSETNTMGAGQFISVFDKRILHVGSVNDFRTLNFVNDASDTDSLDNPTGTMNGAVPGRNARKGEGQFGLGTSNFFGQLSDGWFYGTELHVDEPVTITRYRDLMAVGRLLDVEGDVIIGPHIHKNFPNIKYGTRGGGLWVRSTLTDDPRTAKMLKEGSGSLFTEDMLNGNIKLEFEPYIRKGSDLTTDGTENNDAWNNHISRHKGDRGKFESSTNALKTPNQRSDDNPLFSAFFEDTLGSRVLVAEDGIAIYDPDKKRAMFSVDAFGNIQTYAREIRSNAVDTAWYFHTKWPTDGVEHKFNDAYKDFWGALGVESTATNPDLPVSFKVPEHNELVFASDHEIQFMGWGSDAGDIKSLFSRYWRGSNVIEAIKNGEPNELYDANYWRDPSMYPAGYFHTFGFADSEGHSHPTFPNRFAGDEARTWGSSEYLPTILSLPLDLAWVWGGQLVTGINPRAFDHDFDGRTYRMRAGSTITYGQFIHEPLRDRIGAIDGKFDFNVYKGKDLTIEYSHRSELGKLSGNSMGDDAKLFADSQPASIGSWNMHGSVIEGAMFVGGDFLAYQSASIRGQIRAKSFRRHINSLNEGSEWAFMLDNGKSSYSAPAHKNYGCTCADDGFFPQNQTPLVLDLGETFGEKRLVRFGTAETVTLNKNGEIVVGTGGSDRKICLLGRYPNSHSIKSGTFGQLMAGSNCNGGRWIMFSDGRFVTINFEINLDYCTKAGSHRKWFHGNDQYQTYGIKVCAPDGKHLLANTEGGNNRQDLAVDLDCIELGIASEFQPAIPVDAHIQALKSPATNVGRNGGSLGHSAAAKSWGWDGRDSQFGITFRLVNENGKCKLKIARTSGASLMVGNNPGQTLSFSFTYPLGGLYKGGVPIIGKPNETKEPEYYDIIFFISGNLLKREEKDEETGETVKVLDTSKGCPWGEKAIIKGVIDPGGTFVNMNDPNYRDVFEDYDNWKDCIKKGDYDAVIMASISSDNGAFDIVKNLHYTAANWKTRASEYDWSIVLEREGIEGNDGYFAQCTERGIFNNTGDSDYFDGNEKNVPSGVFRKLGVFADGSTLDADEFVVKTSKRPVQGPFSVHYWESSGTSFLRLTIACDSYWRGSDKHYYSHTWGIRDVNDDKNCDHDKGWYEKPTNAYLPYGAKLPKNAVRAQLAGSGGAFSDWRDNRIVRGGGILRLNPDGSIIFERLINSRALAQGESNIDMLQVVSVLFAYPSSDKTMDKDYYTEKVGNSSGGASVPDEPDPGTPIQGGDDDSSEDNWTWEDLADPTPATLERWLKDGDRTALHEAIIAAFDADSDYIDAFTAPYGQATLKRSDNTVEVSLWVTATGPSGLTHRSINFTAGDFVASETNPSYTISNLNTILLKNQTNPGYYKSEKISNNKPDGSTIYLGTSQTANSTSNYPYIWYTTDGETWQLIDYPITLDPNYIYVLCTTDGATVDNPAVTGSPERRVPAGFMCTFKGSTGTDADLNIFNGAQYFSTAPSRIQTSTWPRTTDSSGKSINERNIIDALGGKTAIAGYVRSVPGFTRCYRIHKNNWNTTGRRTASNWSSVSIPGQSSTATWQKLSEYMPDNIRQGFNCWWVDANGNYVQQDEDAIILVSTFTSANLRKFKNWLGVAFNHYLIGGDWRARKDAKYSPYTGWTGLWERLVINQPGGFGHIIMGTETSQKEPNSNTGSGAGCLLHCDMHSDIQFSTIQIRGQINMNVGGFDRTGEVPGAKYLTSAFGINPDGGYWPTGMGSDIAYKLSIPAIYDLYCDLIVQGNNKLYKVLIDEANGRFDCVEVGTGGASYDDTAIKNRLTSLESKSHDIYDDTSLKNRIAALENMIRTISTTPDIITVNVPAGQTSVDIEITEKDVNENVVDTVDPLTIKTESGLTHNG